MFVCRSDLYFQESRGSHPLYLSACVVESRLGLPVLRFLHLPLPLRPAFSWYSRCPSEINQLKSGEEGGRNMTTLSSPTTTFKKWIFVSSFFCFFSNILPRFHSAPFEPQTSHFISYRDLKIYTTCVLGWIRYRYRYCSAWKNMNRGFGRINSAELLVFSLSFHVGQK